MRPMFWIGNYEINPSIKTDNSIINMIKKYFWEK